MARRQVSVRNVRAVSNDVARLERALNSAAARLRRVGKRREGRDTKRAYSDAADMISNLAANPRRRR